MGHDAHFLERLDRVPRRQVELALGLYRDHELVRALVDDAYARLPAETDRVALALEDGGDGPHVVVARDGGFVTCLGKGMSTGQLPVISRAHLDGLALKVERVREGLALARKRGLDESELLERFERAGSAVSREDFIAASATIGPAAPLLLGMFASWAKALEEIYPLLRSSRSWDAAGRRRSERDLARGAWAMCHSAMVLSNTASRDWVRDWAALPAHEQISPWAFLTMTSAFPFVVRAAWVAGRLGKPMFQSYKTRFATAINSLDQREAGLGLACMGLRHTSLRKDAFRALQAPSIAPSGLAREAWAQDGYRHFNEVVQVLEAKEDVLRAEGIDLGRRFAVIRLSGLPESSRHRCTEPEQVPDDLILPSLFDAWHDANNGERGADLTLIGLVAAARARAEDFYFPATVLHAMGPPELETMGESMVQMRRKLYPKAIPVRQPDRPGRNDACSCGSGKKFKKCHGR